MRGVAAGALFVGLVITSEPAGAQSASPTPTTSPRPAIGAQASDGGWEDRVLAIAALVSATLVGVGLLIAARQLKEAKALRAAQARPFVSLDFDPLARPPLIFLTLQNTGRTMAYNVRFVFEPELSSTLDDTGHGVGQLKLFREGIPSLPPGKVVTLLFDSSLQRKTDMHPDRYEVRVTYSGVDQETYEDHLTLDLGVYENFMYVTTRTVHDVAENLKKIHDEVRKWTARTRGLMIKSPSDLRDEHREFERARKAREGSREKSTVKRKAGPKAKKKAARRSRKRST